MVANNSTQLLFPAHEFKVQSPFLYLQTVGSTGADGSTYGTHARWLLLRNLGDTHLPKGDYASTRVNFNKRNDYVTLLRSQYLERFPTIVDFSLKPKVINDAEAFWIYTPTNTNTTVYIHFRDAAKYAAVRAAVDPSVEPLQFIQRYCPGLIEAEVKNKLFFAAEFDVQRNGPTVMRVEALSVETNVPLSEVFVSCRKVFTIHNWCADVHPSAAVAGTAPPVGAAPVDLPARCDGPNLIINGGFENLPPAELGFETDYALEPQARPGAISITPNATHVNPPWLGLPHTGNSFLTVDGSVTPGKAAVRYRLEVDPETEYCFAGWLSTVEPRVLSVPLEIRFTAADGITESYTLSTAALVNKWEEFAFIWNSRASRSVTVEIISLSVLSFGNDFGIDDLSFCKSRKCRARIMSENIRSVRFDVTSGYPRRLEFETYDDHISSALWNGLDNLALTKVDSTAFSRLEPFPNSVNGHWQKFNDNARLKVKNYEDRWTRAGGLSEGVKRYIERSNSDPLAIVTLEGGAHDGSIEISMLDALGMVSLDFHIARMFGLGYLDRDIKNDKDEFIYLAVYDTEGALDDTRIARPVRHYYMGVPTRPLDYRLPDTPVLKPVTYGLAVDNGELQPTYLTDQQGYTPDGLSRYVNLFVEPETNDAALNPFFVPPDEFCATDKTSSVFYGIEYRKQGEADWRKPEIPHDTFYKDLDAPPQFETLPLPNNNSKKPTLRHDERENGVHEYGSYGVNWFSRVSVVGNVVATDATLIKKAQRLLPPANLAVQLIQRESPLMLTTQDEQKLLASLTGTDHTLVRVTFDYFHVHDINYDFADTVELFFRSEMPRNVVGAVKLVTDDPSDNHKAIIRTMDYILNSQGTTITPALDPTLFGNFVGGVLSCQQGTYIVASISASTEAGEGPIFTVEKNVEGNAADPNSSGAFVTIQKYTAPDLSLSNGPVMFMAVENMASPDSWGTPNPLPKIITIGDGTWTTHTEEYEQDGDLITVKLRGVKAAATVTRTPTAVAEGVYEIKFDSYTLPHHQQHTEPDPVEWYKGAVRVAKATNSNGPKKVLEVLRVEHLGDGQSLVLHAIDNAFDTADQIVTGVHIEVNYYPGYKVYLHADSSHNFTEATILPAPGEGNRKTWLGSRSCDTTQAYHSPVGIPAPIVALEFIEPHQPEQPIGSEFATRPDYYFKSSYTFTIDFGLKPFAVAMYRANEEAVLRALYKDETYAAVRQKLDLLGEDDPFLSARWKNLMSFDYVYDVVNRPFYDPTGSNTNGTFRKFPPDGYAFHNPDKGGALNGSAPVNMLDALKDAVWGSFTALTELPLIYDFIKGPTYVPVPKPQNIRNSQGTLLSPNDPEFDMAPMAKRTGNGFEIQFTDFKLDGTGNNIFFYCGREIGNRGRLGDPGPVAGPVRLINTRPPDSPAVKKMYVQEIDLINGTGPAVNFEVNAYPDVQKVRRMLIYRTSQPVDALSVRTMQLVKTVDIVETNQIGELSILLHDDFEGGFVPYGESLYYRIVAQRKVNSPEGGSDWAPSQPSKLLLTAVPDPINPEAPVITFTSTGPSGSPATLSGVRLSWSPTVYNGTYYLEKMNATGNWVTIYRIKTNDNVTVDLAATDLGTNVLPKENESEDASMYHRFRVTTENSSGLFNLTARVLTL